MKRTSVILLLVLAMLLTATGCGQTDKGDAPTGEGFTLSNEILGEAYTFEYTAAPQRIVTLASPATEMLLALGLADCIVGYAMQENEIPDQYKDAFESLNCITEDWTVSKEAILALEPDFMMFWNGSGDYTHEFLTSNSISTYTMTSDTDGATIESVYADFTNMGKIFSREERAAEIIEQMKAKIQPVETALKDIEPVSVAYVDAYSTGEAVFTAGNALVADIFRAAGGENVMNDTTDPWMNISWEEIAAADPEWIVIGSYAGVEDADYWIDFLKNHPAMSQTEAVKNENFVVVGLVELTVGERVADTVGTLAACFHPDKMQ